MLRPKTEKKERIIGTIETQEATLVTVYGEQWDINT